MDKSRKRSVNFQLTEIRILVDLVLSHSDVIENKKSDAVTWQEKKIVWEEISKKFNASSGVQLRTAENLRLKYEGIKKDLRRKAALKKKSMFLTGGGNYNIPEYLDYEKKLFEILRISIQGLPSVGDNDTEEDSNELRTNNDHSDQPMVSTEIAIKREPDPTPVSHSELQTEAGSSHTNDLDAEQQQISSKRKWTPHTLKNKKTGALHVKKYNQRVHEKVSKLAENKNDLVKLQYETQKAHFEYKNIKHGIKMEILKQDLEIRKKQNQLLAKQLQEQDLKNKILLKQYEDM